jgi:hypothetical protein
VSPKEQLGWTLKKIENELGVRFEQEHEFHSIRKWRMDYALPILKIGIEYNGHHSTGNTGKKTSGHASITGITNDAEKGNEAALLGWTVIRLTALHFDDKARKKHKLSTPSSLITRAIFNAAE